MRKNIVRRQNKFLRVGSVLEGYVKKVLTKMKCSAVVDPADGRTGRTGALMLEWRTDRRNLTVLVKNRTDDKISTELEALLDAVIDFCFNRLVCDLCCCRFCLFLVRLPSGFPLPSLVFRSFPFFPPVHVFGEKKGRCCFSLWSLVFICPF